MVIGTAFAGWRAKCSLKSERNARSKANETLASDWRTGLATDHAAFWLHMLQPEPQEPRTEQDAAGKPPTAPKTQKTALPTGRVRRFRLKCAELVA